MTFKIKFKATFPEVIARTGYKRTFLLAGQWFPKVGVWWQGKWNCHQFHAMTEFFADFGTYDVKVTLPKDNIIGATGVQVSEQDNGNGTKTVGFHAEDVHDFAWTADPNFKVINDTFNGSMGAVKIRLLSYDSHEREWQPYIKCVTDSMRKFDDWYGPYPYAQLTVVDPPHGAGEAGGMEYPTFITGDSGWYIPKGFHLIDLVTEHEFGHQYWYGMVATNEFENGWLDEGINSYTEVKVIDSFYGPDVSVVNWLGGQLGEREIQRMGYLGAPDIDPLSKFSYQDMSVGVYGDITYGKTATMLITLEKIRRRADVAARVAYLLHALSLPASDAGRFHAHGERSRRPGFELVLEPGSLWYADHGLRSAARRFRPGKVVGRESEREEGRDRIRDAGHPAP